MCEKSPKDEHKEENLELLTVEEIENLIQQEMFSAENIDFEYLQRLAETVKHKQQYSSMDAHKALEMFMATHKTEGKPSDSNEEVCPITKKGRRMTIRVLWVAAIMAVLLFTMAIAQAAGFNIFSIFGFWSEEQFYYGSQYVQNSEQQVVELPQLPIDQEFASLQDVFTALKIKDKLLPAWQPEGYLLTDLYISDMIPGRLRFEAFYQAGSSHYNIEIVLYSDMTSVGSGAFEKDAEDMEVCMLGEHTAYVFSNLDENMVTWMDGHYMICVSGNLEVSVLIQVAKSIYE